MLFIVALHKWSHCVSSGRFKKALPICNRSTNGLYIFTQSYYPAGLTICKSVEWYFSANSKMFQLTKDLFTRISDDSLKGAGLGGQLALQRLKPASGKEAGFIKKQNIYIGSSLTSTSHFREAILILVIDLPAVHFQF